MKGILADLLIKLGLDSKEFNSGVDKAKQKTNVFADGIKRIGGMMAAAFSVAAITAFIKSAIEAGKEQIRVENELSAAIRANGKDVQSTLDDYKQFASELQRNSTVGDETTLSLIRLAETMQSKAPKEAAKNAIALSRALGIDLNTATKMAVMAQNDMYTMLARYNPALREAGTAAERTTAYNKLLASGMQMISEELETAAGKAKQNLNIWGDIQEVWGQIILKSKAVGVSLTAISGGLQVIANSDLSFWQKFLALTDVTGKRLGLMLAKADGISAVNKKNEEYKKTYIDYLKELANGKKQEIEQIKTISQLKQETSDLEESLDSYNIKQTAEIQKTLQQIEANKKLIESLTTLKTKREQAFPGDVSMIKPVTEIPKIGQNLSEMADNQDTGITTKYGGSALLGTQVSELDKLNKYASDKLKEGNEIQKELLDERMQNWENFRQDMGAMVADFGVSVVDEFGQAIGEMLATGNFPADFGQNILAIIGSFISNLGKMMIQMGIAAGAFSELMKSAFTNPVSAGLLVAAGLGLVLLGGAIQGAAKAGPMGSSSSSGYVSSPSYSSANSGYSGLRAQDNKVVFEIKGDKLVGVLANTSRKYSNIG